MRTLPIVGILIGLAFAALLWSQRRPPVQTINLAPPLGGGAVVLFAQAGAGGTGGSFVSTGGSGTSVPGAVVGPIEIPVGEYRLHVNADGTWSILSATGGWSGGGVPSTVSGGSGCGPCPSISR